MEDLPRERRAVYHTTMLTDALAKTRDVMVETRALGFEKLRRSRSSWQGARAVGVARALPSVAVAEVSRPPAWW